MSEDLTVFRVPVVVFTETPGVDARDAANRAENLVLGALQLSGASTPRGVLLRNSRQTAELIVVGAEELNVALRNHQFEVRLRDAAPIYRERG